MSVESNELHNCLKTTEVTINNILIKSDCFNNNYYGNWQVYYRGSMRALEIEHYINMNCK